MKIGQNMVIAFAAVAVLWAVLFFDWLLPQDLRMFGIRPLHLSGLRGLLFSPFLHENLGHLTANTGALFVLLTLSLSFNRLLTVEALIVIALGGGGLVWLLGGGNTVHIGASGIIFGLIGFLIFAGIFHRNWKATLISLAVLFFYGATLLTLLVRTPGVSWTGHLFGFLAGVLAAWLTRPSESREA